MTDGEALLAAIIANRDDDTPRFIYADCLEEHGQGDRAEFIRVQCEMARLVEPNMSIVGSKGGIPIRGCDACRSRWASPLTVDADQAIESPQEAGPGMWVYAPTPCRYHLLKRRSDWLLTMSFEKGGWTPLSFATIMRWDRGFPVEMSMLALFWPRHGDELCRTHPLERIHLTGAFIEPWHEFTSTNTFGDQFGLIAGKGIALPGSMWINNRTVLQTRWPRIDFDIRHLASSEFDVREMPPLPLRASELRRLIDAGSIPDYLRD
jgi:uncharacterized protein (TIGR02996 family)